MLKVAVIGAGQAGLSAAYFLRRFGLEPWSDYVVLDGAPQPGGAWQFRWPSLTLDTVNGVHDLPGMEFSEAFAAGRHPGEVKASEAVPRYFAEYERRFELPVRRPVSVKCVTERHGDFRVETGDEVVRVAGLINATGTWERPFLPHYPGMETFAGRQLHTKDYVRADEFRGLHVVVVGGGISAVQLLDEISQVTTTTWVTRSEPRFESGEFTPDVGRDAVAMVEDRVRRGLPPGSVVSVTGLRLTPSLAAARDRGALDRLPMFTRVTETGVEWADGSAQSADVILWATGFRSALDHLAPLHLRGPGGGITMTGRLATQVADRPRVHLLGYGPSASTIGAARAGRAAASELLRALDRSGSTP